MKKPNVIVKQCEEYDVKKIGSIIQKAVNDLKIQIKDNVFIKPNVVTAN